MELIAALGGGGFVLASLVLGGRLMLLARRTRGFPELTLGAGLFLMGGVGYPLLVVAQEATVLDREVRFALAVAYMFLSVVGMWGIGLFTRHVFRPREAWAKAAVMMIPVGYVAGAWGQIDGPGLGALLAGESGPWLLTSYVGIATMGWAATESFRYYGMLRKRLALGLADPVVADRFRLWAFAIYSASAISALGMLLQEVFGIPVSGTNAGHLVVGPLGLVASFSLWLAFQPPAAYVRRVQRRAAASLAA